MGSVGKGGSSEVFKVMSLSDMKIYALKRVSLENTAENMEVRESYMNEIKLLANLRGNIATPTRRIIMKNV